MSETETIDIDATLEPLLKLTPKQRIQLAERLIESVPPYCGDPEIERAWSDEIARRVEDIEQGRVEPVPVEETLKEARERVREIRQQTSPGQT